MEVQPHQQQAAVLDKVRTDILARIADMRKDKDAKDVTFILGSDDDHTKEIRANSTILSMSSPYFRAMFYGPMKEPTSKRLPDVEPHVFEKLLDYVHGSDRCLEIDSVAVAWDIKYASRQFLMPDLERVADAYLRAHLTFANSMEFLAKATEYGADDFKAKVHKVIKHHGHHILETGDLSLLCRDDFVEVIRLFDGVNADTVFDAVLKWSSRQLEDRDALSEFLESILFSEIRWERMSREYFCENVYGKGLLSTDLENRAMFQILSSPFVVEDHQEPDYILRLSVKFTSLDSTPPYFPQVERLFVRTTEADFVPNIGPTLTAKMFSREVCVEPAGLGKLKSGHWEGLTEYDVEPTEVDVFYRMHGDATLFQAANVRVRAFKVMMPTSRNSFLFEVRFDPVQVVPEQNDFYKGAITATLHFEVDIRRSLLLDLQEDLLVGEPSPGPFANKPAGNYCNFRAKVLSWSTSAGGFRILPLERPRFSGSVSQTPCSRLSTSTSSSSTSSVATPSIEYVKERTDHVPFLCQVN